MSDKTLHYSTEAQASKKLPLKKQATILVVDDHLSNVKLLQRKLQWEGMEIITASDGIECLDKVQKCNPDLILLDVMMPDMDGIETCKRLKEDPNTKDIPIIFITAKSSKKGKLEGLNCGAVDYISKPIDLEETIARIRTQLHLREIYNENLQLQSQLNYLGADSSVSQLLEEIQKNIIKAQEQAAHISQNSSAELKPQVQELINTLATIQTTYLPVSTHANA